MNLYCPAPQLCFARCSKEAGKQGIIKTATVTSMLCVTSICVCVYLFYIMLLPDSALSSIQGQIWWNFHRDISRGLHSDIFGVRQINQSILLFKANGHHNMGQTNQIPQTCYIGDLKGRRRFAKGF